MREGAAERPGLFLVQRFATAICPPASRRWIEAIIAETTAIDRPWHQAVWLIGVTRVLAASIGAEADALLSGRHRWGMALALCAAALCGAVFVAGYEALGLDDDVFLGIGSLSGVILAVLGFLAMHRIFQRPETLPGGS